ncbi:MAG: hypothetical protein K940chlam2_00809 [Chlamydiae bacterium]|nr:hypothetical protein [Chlamydiota bacterium]
MTQVTKPQIEKLLLEPASQPNLLGDTASTDKNLQDAALAANDLFERVIRSGKVPANQHEQIVQELADETTKALFAKRIVDKNANSVIKGNLSKLAGAAEKRIYSGFFGTIKQFFHFIGLYNPSEVEKLKLLASHVTTVIK